MNAGMNFTLTLTSLKKNMIFGGKKSYKDILEFLLKSP